jgi:hypothetical protein
VERGTEDSAARFEAIWLLGTRFASNENRQLLLRLCNGSDPLSGRAKQTLNQLEAQLRTGGSRLEALQAHLAIAMRSSSEAGIGNELIGVVEEGLRNPAEIDPALLRQAQDAAGKGPADFAQRQRNADIAFLLWKRP